MDWIVSWWIEAFDLSHGDDFSKKTVDLHLSQVNLVGKLFLYHISGWFYHKRNYFGAYCSTISSMYEGYVDASRST